MAEPRKLAVRPLGKDGPLLPRLGIGLMSLSGIYGDPAPDEQRLKFLDGVYEKGEIFWDTADEYEDSEDLLGKWFAANPEKRKNVFLATKFGIRHHADAEKSVESAASGGFWADGSPEYCRQALEKSLRRLGLDYVDLFYVHRLDRTRPIEITMRALVELKNEGKIRHIGLSECSAESLRRAHAVHPITAVQVEYSPFTLDIETPKIRVLETARELGVAVVCFTPLGHGILGGEIRSRQDVLKPGDKRGGLPWLKEENLAKNLAVVDKIAEIAKGKGITPAQMTLAWLLAQGDEVFPIPGTTKLHRLEENLASIDVKVSPQDDNAIREAARGVSGPRVQALTKAAFADTPPL